MLNNSNPFVLKQIPKKWDRLGKVMHRGVSGEFDSDVTGDPCIVWDDNRNCYHMFYFAQFKKNGVEHNRDGHAICENPVLDNIKNWKKLGEVQFSNCEEMLGKNTHKPWILMDPYRPNVAARWRDRYWLFTISYEKGSKFIQAAYSSSLDGPWTIDPSLNIKHGGPEEPDGLHLDAVTAYYFEERNKILLFYMAYPIRKQEDTPWTPFGSRSMSAEIDCETGKISKLGTALLTEKNKWTNGYIGGLQLVKSSVQGWYALINASPTPPCSVEEDADIREPAPSLGGFAFTTEEYPSVGWKAMDPPIEYLEEIPSEACADGEGVNMWRHHLLVTDSHIICLYNTGSYGNEQMFGKIIKSSLC